MSLCTRQSFSILSKILSDNLSACGDHMQTMYNNHHQNQINDGETPKSYLKLHQGNVFLQWDLILLDVLHQFLLLGLVKYEKGSAKIQTIRTMNQIKRCHKPISLIQPEVVETKLLEAEDRTSNEHPSLSQ